MYSFAVLHRRVMCNHHGHLLCFKVHQHECARSDQENAFEADLLSVPVRQYRLVSEYV